MRKILKFAIVATITIAIALVALNLCRTRGAWTFKISKSPALFDGKKTGFYYASVEVGWQDGTYDSLNDKTIRLYLADDTIGSGGRRTGVILEDEWKIKAASVRTEIEWQDPNLILRIVDDRSTDEFLSKTYEINDSTAKLLPQE
ncbi:hypothetical protein [Roseibacillus persicicus]|uniref:hypothetical protein n=1 Tax=Roseibacillus persicicus TaxID=454148 RepID=UPI0028108DAD|nr:hypothetical protein [Roseibacillus persicicus]MDQ8192725.1 hypothetical protein [Roseibacillus persicicus]